MVPKERCSQCDNIGVKWLCTQGILHFQSVARCTQNSSALEVAVGSHSMKVIGDGILKKPFEIDGFRKTLMTFSV